METHALEQMLRIHTKDDATLKAHLKTRIVKDGDWLRLPSYMHVADQYIRLLCSNSKSSLRAKTSAL